MLFINNIKQYWVLIIILGAYVPMTVEGTIVVDGVLASCYGSYDHAVGHFMMTPIGWFPYITESIFGVGKGSPVYVNMACDLGEWLLPYQFVYIKK